MRVFLLSTWIAALAALAACSSTNKDTQEVRAEPSPALSAPPPAVLADALAQRSAQSAERARRSQASKMAGHMIVGMPAPMPTQDRERYQHFDVHPVHAVAEDPVSTFAADVDTGSYANLRRFLQQGRLPPEDAVRVEEFINAFDYGYAAPQGRNPEPPFALDTELVPTPWNRDTRLLRVGIQGWLPEGPLPPSNLVFLVDVSGSMQDQDKLPLLQASLRLLLPKLRAEDRISLVTYAGGVRTVLEPTPGDQQARILAAIEELSAGGSTNGADGIRRAYAAAHQAYIEGGINRILLCTDGDFNVGTVNFEQLKDLVERERSGGVALSTFGFGQGNYNDHLMEQLADAGNGAYGYVDSLMEAQKLFVRNRAATLQTIAKDVKIQIEFNPAVVAEYRLIGYENRALTREDFSNDKVDAGEIGAGHSVTALYEIALVGSKGQRLEPLRYAQPEAVSSKGDELAFLRLRYKAPDGDTSKLIERPIRRSDALQSIARASEATRWAAAVAAFGQTLRGGKYLDDFGYDDIKQLAVAARGQDAYGDRGEMLKLLDLAQGLTRPELASRD